MAEPDPIPVKAEVDETDVMLVFGDPDGLQVGIFFPNTGEVDREEIASLFQVAAQSYPQILDQMEAQR